MRYITIPEPEPMRGMVVINNETKEQKPVIYSLADLNNEFVWTSQAWRQNETAIRSFGRCVAAFDGKGPGEIVELEGEDFEQYKKIAVVAGVGQNPPIAPQASMAITYLLVSVLTASDKAPAKEPEPESEAATE